MSQASEDTECVIETRKESEDAVCITENIDENYRIEFLWKIPRKVLDNLKTEKTILSSKDFDTQFCASTWRLQMKNNESYFSIFLNKKNANQSILFRFTVILRTSSTTPDKVLREENFRRDNRGLHNWMSHEEIEKYWYWHDDYLIITCKVEMKVAYEEVYHFPSNKSFQELLDTGIHSDLVLSVDNRKYNVHRGILAARCEYFNTMFGSNFKESEQSCVEIEGIEEDTFYSILSYIYTGYIYTGQTSSDDMMFERNLLIAADKLLLVSLAQECEYHLCDKIKLENCVDFLIFAETHSRSKLKEEVVKFINKNFKTVLETESWKQMKAEHIHLAVEVFEFFHTQGANSSSSSKSSLKN